MSGSEGGEGSSHRYAPNLQGVLQLATEHTRSEDAPAEGSSHSMDEEVT